MKRFIVSVLCASVFFIGLGAIVEKAGAKFKSDEKALGLIRQARTAIGGDQAIAEVRSMTISGRTTSTFKIDGAERTDQGEAEIALQLPDKFSKMLKIGRQNGSASAEEIVDRQHDVVILNKGGEGPHRVMLEGKDGQFVSPDGKRVIVSKIEGGNAEIEKFIAEGKDGEFTTSDGKKVVVKRADLATAPDKTFLIRKKADGTTEHLDGKQAQVFERELKAANGPVRQNEMLRTTLALLLSAPDGMEVSYTFAGEGDVDGTACNIVNAEAAGSSFKLYLSKASSLPVMISYQGHQMPRVVRFKSDTPNPDGAEKHVKVFTRTLEGPGESAEYQVRFSDYRSINGVQLPYKWTTNIAGRTTEVFDVTAYDINPANIAEKFQNQKVFVRTRKADGQ